MNKTTTVKNPRVVRDTSIEPLILKELKKPITYKGEVQGVNVRVLVKQYRKLIYTESLQVPVIQDPELKNVDFKDVPLVQVLGTLTGLSELELLKRIKDLLKFLGPEFKKYIYELKVEFTGININGTKESHS